MGLRLFETDPDAAPKPRQSFADDLVGRFRSGYQVSNRPVALEKWRVTTGDPDVAARISDLLGGEAPQTWETSGEDSLEVFTTAPKVDIVIESPRALRQEMALWNRNNQAIRRCDGVEQHGENAEGKACECPRGFQDRKDAAKAGTGCQPNTTLFFRLAADPDLGLFKFSSGSWSLVRDLGPEEDKLTEIDGPAEGTLSLEVVEFESAGTKKRFIKPVISVKRACS